MFDAAVTAAFQGIAKTLHDQARREKRLEQHHRRQAARLNRQYERFAAMCNAHGIDVTFIDTDR